MATVTVRGLDEEVRRRLKVRAATNNRSMEAEVRALLAAAVEGTPGPGDPDRHEGPVVLPQGGAARPDPTDGVSGPPASTGVPASLTVREERVAALVVEGLTNREIAASLYLSERTVEGHVSTILRKLGCRRTSLAARYPTRG